jgi:hypothetical protein
MAEGRPPLDGRERRQSLTLLSLRLQRPDYGTYLSTSGTERAPAHDPQLPLAATTWASVMQRLRPVAASPRTHGLGHLAVVRARTGWRHYRPLVGALLTLPATAVAVGGEDPSTHVKPRDGQVERLLLLGSTGHCRPKAALQGRGSHMAQTAPVSQRVTWCT